MGGTPVLRSAPLLLSYSILSFLLRNVALAGGRGVRGVSRTFDRTGLCSTATYIWLARRTLHFSPPVEHLARV